ncbi:MAG: hypothetical protein QGG67_07825 [Gammaproteobacteria bacterium]|nr:hypothetical protein [Gammaproteobacteria bacterium]
MNRGLCLLATIIGTLSAVSSGEMDEEVPDVELLEFLGSWEDQDDWQDFFDAATESDDDTLEEKTTNGSVTNAK